MIRDVVSQPIMKAEGSWFSDAFFKRESRHNHVLINLWNPKIGLVHHFSYEGPMRIWGTRGSVELFANFWIRSPLLGQP